MTNLDEAGARNWKNVEERINSENCYEPAIVGMQGAHCRDHGQLMDRALQLLRVSRVLAAQVEHAINLRVHDECTEDGLHLDAHRRLVVGEVRECLDDLHFRSFN